MGRSRHASGISSQYIRFTSRTFGTVDNLKIKYNLQSIFSFFPPLKSVLLVLLVLLVFIFHLKSVLLVLLVLLVFIFPLKSVLLGK